MLNLIANLVLQDTVERVYAGTEYAELQRGVCIVRGENVVLLGEIVSTNSKIERSEFRFERMKKELQRIDKVEMIMKNPTLRSIFLRALF